MTVTTDDRFTLNVPNTGNDWWTITNTGYLIMCESVLGTCQWRGNKCVWICYVIWYT